MINFRNILNLFIGVFCFPQNCDAKYFKYSRDYYINIIKNGDKSTPISNNTIVTPVYDQNMVTILFYENVNDETNHGQSRVIVLKNEKYSYSYSADSDSCFVRYKMLRCLTGYREGPYYDITLSDIIAGKRILIGGYFSDAYDGRGRKYRPKMR